MAESQTRTALIVVDVQRAFDAWRITYNFDRPHQALDLQPPASRYRPSSRPMPECLPVIVIQPQIKYSRSHFRPHSLTRGCAAGRNFDPSVSTLECLDDVKRACIEVSKLMIRQSQRIIAEMRGGGELQARPVTSKTSKLAKQSPNLDLQAATFRGTSGRGTPTSRPRSPATPPTIPPRRFSA